MLSYSNSLYPPLALCVDGEVFTGVSAREIDTEIGEIKSQVVISLSVLYRRTRVSSSFFERKFYTDESYTYIACLCVRTSFLQ